ncbi:MAG: hypothetical protein QXU40_02140 [Candidatus Pacearchaeota archaeon]
MENIKFSDWQKIDLRVGKILKVEEIDGADKLYKLEVNLGKGLGIRNLVAGIKQHYKRNELIGKKCVVFTNLEHRKIKGVESQGMILAAVSDDEKEVCLLKPEKEIKEGSKIM